MALSVPTFGYLFSGDTYLSRLSAAKAFNGRYIDPINAISLAIQPNSEEIERVSNMRRDWGQAKNSAFRPQPPTLTWGGDDMPSTILAAAFLGNTSAINAVGATIADENVILAATDLGEWVSLANRNLDAGSVVVQDMTDTTTYVEDTDYEINYRLGLIRAITGGAISAETLHVDYVHSTITGTLIQGGLNSTLDFRIILDGYNIFEGKNSVLSIWEATSTPSDALDFFSGETLSATFNGKINNRSDQSEPYRFEDWDAGIGVI